MSEVNEVKWECPVCGNDKHEQLVDTEGYGHLQEPGARVGRPIGYKCTSCTVQFQDPEKFTAAAKDKPVAEPTKQPTTPLAGTCSQYKTISESKLELLDKKVNDYLSNGWCLHGGLIVEPHDSEKKQGGATLRTGQQYIQVVKKRI